MKELLEQATKFLKDHPEVNEIELSDPYNCRVHLVRITPAPNYWPQWNWTYQPSWPAIKTNL